MKSGSITQMGRVYALNPGMIRPRFRPSLRRPLIPMTLLFLYSTTCRSTDNTSAGGWINWVLFLPPPPGHRKLSLTGLLFPRKTSSVRRKPNKSLPCHLSVWPCQLPRTASPGPANTSLPREASFPAFLGPPKLSPLPRGPLGCLSAVISFAIRCCRLSGLHTSTHTHI